jgi:hypothetical protein
VIGTTLAHYRITAALGAGGMGEVWRATDTKLGREVALKVLPEAFSSDPDRLARFEREAKVLASLNHPNIAHLYGLERISGKETVSPSAAGTGSGSGSDSSPEPQASSPSSHPAAETAAPQGAQTDEGAVVGDESRVPGGSGGNSKLRIQNSELPAAAGPSPKPQAPRPSSHSAAGTATPPSGPTLPDGLVGHASRVPDGGGGVE